MQLLRIVGVTWIIVMVVGYIGYRLTNESGAGILTTDGTGDLYVIFAACAPGAALFSWSSRRRKEEQDHKDQPPQRSQ